MINFKEYFPIPEPMNKPLHEQLDELRQELKEAQEILAETSDEFEKEIFAKGIELIKKEIAIAEKNLFGLNLN